MDLFFEGFVFCALPECHSLWELEHGRVHGPGVDDLGLAGTGLLLLQTRLVTSHLT